MTLMVKDAAIYFDLLRDIYESYVIYLFMALMVTYLGDGDENKVLECLEDIPPISHPVCSFLVSV
jgi:hypothetical protein